MLLAGAGSGEPTSDASIPCPRLYFRTRASVSLASDAVLPCRGRGDLGGDSDVGGGGGGAGAGADAGAAAGAVGDAAGVVAPSANAPVFFFSLSTRTSTTVLSSRSYTHVSKARAPSGSQTHCAAYQPSVELSGSTQMRRSCRAMPRTAAVSSTAELLPTRNLVDTFCKHAGTARFRLLHTQPRRQTTTYHTVDGLGRVGDVVRALQCRPRHGEARDGDHGSVLRTGASHQRQQPVLACGYHHPLPHGVCVRACGMVRRHTLSASVTSCTSPSSSLFITR